MRRAAPRRRRGLTWLVLPVLLTGCVAPTTGLTSAYPESQREPFAVRFATPQDAPRPASVGGSLNILGTGRTALVQGWATTSSSVLVLVSDVPVRVVEAEREQRPDAAQAMGAPTDPELGFRLRVRARQGLVGRMCVLSERPDGLVEVLEGSDPEWCTPS